MIVRYALFSLMALGLLGFGAVAWVSAHPVARQAQGPTELPAATLAVARDLRAGTLLRAEDLVARPLPSTQLSADTLADTPDTRRDIVGGMVRRSLGAGEPLRTGDVMRPGEHGFLAAVLKPGRRAVSIGVDNVSGTAGLIWPGDRVDVVLTQTMDDATLPPDRRIAAETVMQDALVIAIDRLMVQGAAPDAPEPAAPRTVTLEVSNAEVARIQVAARIGRLSLAVRSADMPGDPAEPAAPVWAGDVSRALRPRSPAPAPAQSPAIADPPPALLHVFHGGTESKEYRF